MSHNFAVIGNPISHSLSPIIHQEFARQCGINLKYEKILGEERLFEQQVQNFFQNKGKGLNVTLPFKARAYAMASVAHPRAKLAQAANTLWLEADGLHVDNTDGVGLLRDLLRHMPLNQKRILILGAGGATRGIIGDLLTQQPETISVANRNPERLSALLQSFPAISGLSWEAIEGTFDILINATSAQALGRSLQLPFKIWQNQPFCYDLSYSLNKETPFVLQAREQGCVATDGLGMLVEQAAEAFRIWHKLQPDSQYVLQLLNQQRIP